MAEDQETRMVFQLDQESELVTFIGGNVGEVMSMLRKLAEARIVEDIGEWKLIVTPSMEAVDWDEHELGGLEPGLWNIEDTPES